jgi:hypothetical protein
MRLNLDQATLKGVEALRRLDCCVVAHRCLSRPATPAFACVILPTPTLE